MAQSTFFKNEEIVLLKRNIEQWYKIYNRVIFIAPRYCGLSLLRTPNDAPEGVRTMTRVDCNRWRSLWIVGDGEQIWNTVHRSSAIHTDRQRSIPIVSDPYWSSAIHIDRQRSIPIVSDPYRSSAIHTDRRSAIHTDRQRSIPIVSDPYRSSAIHTDRQRSIPIVSDPYRSSAIHTDRQRSILIVSDPYRSSAIHTDHQRSIPILSDYMETNPAILSNPEQLPSAIVRLHMRSDPAIFSDLSGHQ